MMGRISSTRVACVVAVTTLYFCALGGSATAQVLDPGSGDLDCVMQPHLVVAMGSSVEGLLAEVAVDRGDIVERGQLVAKLESSVEEATVELARVRARSDLELRTGRARLEFQAAKFVRTQALYAKEVATAETLERTRAEKRLAELDVRKAQLNMKLAAMELKRARSILKRRTILSPIDGVIVKRSLSIGEYVYEQAQVMTVARIDPLNIEVFVPIARYGSIKIGMSAEVRPEEPVGGVYVARVTVVDQVFDAASGTFGVRLELPNPDRGLPAGLKCKVRF